jgi:hypothetical protein
MTPEELKKCIETILHLEKSQQVRVTTSMMDVNENKRICTLHVTWNIVDADEEKGEPDGRLGTPTETTSAHPTT